MLEGLRMLVFGYRPPPSGAEIPRNAREAHHRLQNTAMKVKQQAREIDREANDLLELLARDIKQTGERKQ